MDKNEEEKLSWGGKRPNSGRRLLNQSTSKIRIPQFYYDTIKKHVNQLKKVGGKYISMQEYCSRAVIKASEQSDENSLKEIAENLAPGSNPWATLALTELAYQKLGEIVSAIAPLSPVYTNLSNVFTVIILKEMRSQRKNLNLS